MKRIAGALALLLLVAGAAQADTGRSAPLTKRAVGAWQLTSGVVGGTPIPGKAVRNIRLYLTAGHYRLAGAESPDRGTWKLVPPRNPQGLDVTGTSGPNKGKTFHAIVQLVGNRMTVCYDLSGRSRPRRFQSKPKSTLFLAEYQRITNRGQLRTKAGRQHAH